MESTTHEQSVYMVAEIQLVYRSKVKPSQRPKITTSRDAYNIFLDSWDKDLIELVEQFKVMLLNRANKVLGILELSTGGITGTVADPKLIFAAAVKSAACGIVLCHNHPSGLMKPSKQDELLSSKIKEAGKFLDINVMDSLIISTETYYSFADEGLL